MSDQSGGADPVERARRALELLRHSARVSPILQQAVEDVSGYIRHIEAEAAALSGRSPSDG